MLFELEVEDALEEGREFEFRDVGRGLLIIEHRAGHGAFRALSGGRLVITMQHVAAGGADPAAELPLARHTILAGLLLRLLSNKLLVKLTLE